MTKLEQIEKFALEVEEGELEKFAAWFEQLQAQRWDTQFSNDVESGAINDLAKDAIRLQSRQVALAVKHHATNSV